MIKPFIANWIKDAKAVVQELKECPLYCPMSNYDKCTNTQEFTICYNYTMTIDRLVLSIIELKEELKKHEKQEHCDK